MSRYEKKMKNKLDDEIKLAGLESLVPEELEKHLILNSNRLRTFEDARLEVVTYVEAKFGVRVRDSKPSGTRARGHSDPMDVDAVNSLSSGKGKGSSSRVMGVLSVVEHIFNETAMHAKSTGKQSYGKGKQSKSWSKSEGKGKGEEAVRNPKENPMEPKVRTKVPKAHTRAKHRKLVSQVLKPRNRMQSRTLKNLHKHIPLILPGMMVGIVTNGTMAGVLMSGMMTGVPLDGTKVGNNRKALPQAHFHLEVWMSVPPVVRSGLNG